MIVPITLKTPLRYLPGIKNLSIQYWGYLYEVAYKNPDENNFKYEKRITWLLIVEDVLIKMFIIKEKSIPHVSRLDNYKRLINSNHLMNSSMVTKNSTAYYRCMYHDYNTILGYEKPPKGFK